MRDGGSFPACAVATSIRMARRWREGGFGLLGGTLIINNCCVFAGQFLVMCKKGKKGYFVFFLYLLKYMMLGV